MLQKLDPPMSQSPDVQGLTIDFGDAPAHGRWRAMKMTVTYSSGRRVGWCRHREQYELTGLPSCPSLTSAWRSSSERVTHIQLEQWELLE